MSSQILDGLLCFAGHTVSVLPKRVDDLLTLPLTPTVGRAVARYSGPPEIILAWVPLPQE